MTISGKAIYKKYPDRMIRSKAITGSELRWIYRNKNYFKVQQTLQFWHKSKACCPPWMEAFDKKCGRQVSKFWLGYIRGQDLCSGLSKLFKCKLNGL